MVGDAKPGGGGRTNEHTRKPGQSSGSTLLGQFAFPLCLCPQVSVSNRGVFLLPAVILRITSDKHKSHLKVANSLSYCHCIV